VQSILNPVSLRSREEINPMSLFRQGWKAEEIFGSEITAYHMNTRSVYRFKENDNVSITHFAKYVEDETVDVFTVSVREEINPRHSVTKTVEVFDNWLDAYYSAVQCVNNLNLDFMTL
jgi:hypothetical protein